MIRRTKNTLLLAVVAISIISCVPNRKVVYLQKDDINNQSLPKDTVVREYSYVDFNYRIQPEDILSIRFESLTPDEYDFFSNENPLAGQAVNQQVNPLLIGELVDLQGMVPFPVIGKVKVAGLTVYQAQDTLQAIANQYLQSPLVKVRLINFRYTILGEVLREGTVTLVNNRVTILEAIGQAGGLSDLADKRNIKLIRQRNGKAEVQYIDLLDENFIASPNFYINQNDVLIIPALRQRPYRKYFGQNVQLLVSTVSLVLLTINLIDNSNN